MIGIIDTDTILFGVLKDSEDLLDEITGGIYAMGERPDNSELEDIVISTITLTQDAEPQLGVSNVNIHVKDIDVTINNIKQKKADRARLKTLTDMVAGILRDATVNGLSFQITNQTQLREPEINQHFINLRIEWSIH